MTISVNTSRSALNALQTLARGNDPSAAQNRTTAGKAPTDKPAAAPAARPDAVSLAAVKRSLDRAASISDLALGTGQTVSDLLDQFRLAAAEAPADSAGRQDLAARLQATVRQIDNVVQKAGFDGANLLDGSLGDDLRFNLDGGAALTLSPRNLRPGGPLVTLAADTDASALLAAADESRLNVSSALADLRVQSRQVEAHTRFVSRFGEALAQADGDFSKETARLHALQVQQQLAGQQLSIANQAPKTVLQLFR